MPLAHLIQSITQLGDPFASEYQFPAPCYNAAFMRGDLRRIVILIAGFVIGLHVAVSRSGRATGGDFGGYRQTSGDIAVPAFGTSAGVRC